MNVCVNLSFLGVSVSTDQYLLSLIGVLRAGEENMTSMFSLSTNSSENHFMSRNADFYNTPLTTERNNVWTEEGSCHCQNLFLMQTSCELEKYAKLCLAQLLGRKGRI